MTIKSEKHYIGELATFDSFTGMIACKTIELLPNHRMIRIQITANKNKAYKRGEFYTTFEEFIIPRKLWKRSRKGSSYIIVLPYIWVEK